ncbi:acyl-CoA thioesterase [Arthrobacter sp. NPDC058130]|uniref:acyl-CoA thioesterase n=1 Tax=Arthrobacter sp. NPDC058130 TaxID=3346353 RepID=UPI0036ED66A5
MPETPFINRLRVRYHETDPQRFVFNSRYLEYADVSMAEYFRDLGWSYPELLDLDFDPSVVRTEISYLRPIYLDDLVDIEVCCTRVGTSSFTLVFSFMVAGEQVCRIESVYVNVYPVTGKSRPIPEAIARQIQASRLEPTSATGAVEANEN